jgi:valyl-tRNA synthetase
MASTPARPSLVGLETKWDADWEAQGTYRFDRSKARDVIYAIDTPPPTVSGSLHLGSAFGYIQTDALARFQRISGREVFYPMGWDDNGLPTERRVQNYYGVRCDATVPYDPAAEPAAGVNNVPRPISRRNFIELCHRLTEEDEKVFERVWRSLGLSVDWTLTYATIGDRARRVAQRAFIRNFRRGEAYASEAPTLWDVDFGTAVAQAEIEDRETPSALHRVSFHRADGGGPVVVETTRPELLPSCVALVTHPDDDRYRSLVGTEVLSPLFGVRLPVVAHRLAEPEKGSGIAMICTFGDTTDVTWWRELGLPLRVVMQRDGRLQSEVPAWLTGRGAEAWAEVGGKSTAQARARIVEMLRSSGDLVGQSQQITHPVKYFEKGDRPLEIVTSRQWYIRNGAHDPELRKALLGRGRELRWHPDFMRVRYEHWVEGLNSDWLISRQRFFGVPFPVWYRLGDDGKPLWDQVIVADEEMLPIDPQSDAPAGYTEEDRGRPGGFLADPDVMDTWATSSLSPQIICGWVEDPDLFDRTFPMNLRPQGPEIIRTWLFSSVLRSHFEHNSLPWSDAFINGWIVDPDRKKMSKSKGNVVTPSSLVEQYGADGLRYWACRAAPGADTTIDEPQMKNGRRLAVKLLNASKFVLGVSSGGGSSAPVTEVLDRAMLAQLAAVVDDATASFETYNYHHALARTETFFWQLCDDYLELVKDRAYGEGAAADSAQAALSRALSTVLRLFAPILPFASEEVWSWWQSGSIHRSRWPAAVELRALAAGADPAILDVTAEVLAAVRKAKTAERRSLRQPVTRLTVEDVPDRLAALRAAEADLRQAGSIAELVLREAPERSITVELGLSAGVADQESEDSN